MCLLWAGVNGERFIKSAGGGPASGSLASTKLIAVLNSLKFGGSPFDGRLTYARVGSRPTAAGGNVTYALVGKGLGVSGKVKCIFG